MAYEGTSTSEGIRLLRDDFLRHEQRDREDFSALTEKIESINQRLSTEIGWLAGIKWIAALGIPTILAGIIAILMRLPK
jgi:hypothetical protein